MPALAIASPAQKRLEVGRGIVASYRAVLFCTLLTPLALVVHGYHPDSEDGGIYLAGIKYLLNPRLYPYATEFVTAHLHLSVMARVVALLTRATALPVMTIMLMLQVSAIFFTLYSASMLARRLFQQEGAQLSAVALLAASLMVPVAGTSLVLMDPYVTARSFATPLVLLAFAGALDTLRMWQQRSPNVIRSLVSTVCALVAAALMHPLSGGYGAAVLVVFAACALPSRRGRLLALTGCASAAMSLAFLLCHTDAHLSAAYRSVAQTRAYWFLSNWAWYEVLGIVAPVSILLWAGARPRFATPARVLLTATAFTAVIGTAVSLLFAHPGAASYAVARVQPLRVFQVAYVLMVLCLGDLCARLFRRPLLRAIPCVVAAAMLFMFQRSIYGHSGHLELPWRAPANPWSQAFLWIRANTPSYDVVALDANYIEAPSEDAQSFRSISERSMFADFSKDGGIASIRPELAEDWKYGMALQFGLNALSERERRTRLPIEVKWVVLPAGASATLACPYRNQAVAVCRLGLR